MTCNAVLSDNITISLFAGINMFLAWLRTHFRQKHLFIKDIFKWPTSYFSFLPSVVDMIFLTPVIQGIVITRTHWWTFWITLGLMSLSGDTLFRGQCQSEGYSKFALNNSRLKNYVISTHSVRSLEDCALLCLNDTHCSSYNFHISSFLHKCELNSKSRWSAKPGSLMVENGYQHYEMEDLTEVSFEYSKAPVSFDRGVIWIRWTTSHTIKHLTLAYE